MIVNNPANLKAIGPLWNEVNREQHHEQSDSVPFR